MYPGALGLNFMRFLLPRRLLHSVTAVNMPKPQPPRVPLDPLLENPHGFDRGLFDSRVITKALKVNSKHCNSLCKKLKSHLLKLGKTRTVVPDESDDMKRILLSTDVSSLDSFAEHQKLAVQEAEAEASTKERRPCSAFIITSWAAAGGA